MHWPGEHLMLSCENGFDLHTAPKWDGASSSRHAIKHAGTLFTQTSSTSFALRPPQYVLSRVLQVDLGSLLVYQPGALSVAPVHRVYRKQYHHGCSNQAQHSARGRHEVPGWKVANVLGVLHVCVVNSTPNLQQLFSVWGIT